MDKELDRILFRGVEIWRTDDEALDFDFADGREPEGVHLREVELGKESGIEVGDPDFVSESMTPCRVNAAARWSLSLGNRLNFRSALGVNRDNLGRA